MPFWHRELKWLAHDHAAGHWQYWEENLDFLLNPVLFLLHQAALKTGLSYFLDSSKYSGVVVAFWLERPYLKSYIFFSIRCPNSRRFLCLSLTPLTCQRRRWRIQPRLSLSALRLTEEVLWRHRLGSTRWGWGEQLKCELFDCWFVTIGRPTTLNFWKLTYWIILGAVTVIRGQETFSIKKFAMCYFRLCRWSLSHVLCVCVFQPFKNIKTIFSSRAIQNEVANWIWLAA